MHLVKLDPRLRQHLAGDFGLEDALVRQGRVGPPDEPVVAVPRALAVSEKAQLERRVLIETGERSAGNSAAGCRCRCCGGSVDTATSALPEKIIAAGRSGGSEDGRHCRSKNFGYSTFSKASSYIQ